MEALLFVNERFFICSSVVGIIVNVPFSAVVPLNVEDTSISSDCSELSLDLNGVGLDADVADATGDVVTANRILRSEISVSSEDVAGVDCVEESLVFITVDVPVSEVGGAVRIRSVLPSPVDCVNTSP